MTAPDSKITEIPNVCPRCQGQIYDNTKGRGKSSPKSPDARCKDRDNCGWAGWLPEGSKTARGASKGPQEYPWAQLMKLCVQYTKKEIAPLLSNTTDEDVIYKYAFSIFLAGKEGGDIFKKPEAAPVTEPQPPAPRPAPPPRRAEYDDTMEDLPF